MSNKIIIKIECCTDTGEVDVVCNGFEPIHISVFKDILKATRKAIIERADENGMLFTEENSELVCDNCGCDICENCESCECEEENEFYDEFKLINNNKKILN